jgi:site-specific DNA-methyltransferase (adenine-specific)
LEINKIYNGDCLELMQEIKDKSIDMILCDLPYNLTRCKWDVMIPLDKLWEQYKRIIKDNGAIVLTACQPFTSMLVMSNLKMFRYEWIWEKTKATESNLYYPKRIINFKTEHGLHPTQKPVALFEYLIKTYTNEGDLVLDNCSGSFTTAIASENLKRNWICIEKEAEYCAIGEKRIKENRERLLNIANCAKLDI